MASQFPVPWEGKSGSAECSAGVLGKNAMRVTNFTCASPLKVATLRGLPATPPPAVGLPGAAAAAPTDVSKLSTNRGEEQRKAQPAHAATGPGRNDPCPCGSGKKYKKCHGAGAA